MYKIIIVVGTRPNFIKITQFEKELGKYPNLFEYILVHTGQHYDDNMSKVFFDQLNLKKPDYYLNVERPSPATQIGHIIVELDTIIQKEKPNLLMVVGDVNSTLAGSIAANKNNIPLAHLESGLRSFDKSMPEEHNRNVTDLLADYLFVTEDSGMENLLKEGKPKNKLFFVGNTMIDTLVAFEEAIEEDNIMEKLSLNQSSYALTTMHRPNNVDSAESLEWVVNLINYLTKQIKLVFPIHPRTLKNLESYGLMEKLSHKENLIFTEPLGYLSFQKLIKYARLVITDSGGVQEETTFRKVPCLTLRPNTERPSTITYGSNKLLEYDFEKIKIEVDNILQNKYKSSQIPPLWDGKATQRIVQVLKTIAEKSS
jgi:UDP-N-acetylglucosamine 2-epimerase (non-hydrolysing)